MSYPGGKGAAGVAQTIINQMPPHDLYVEAFLGSGAVMRAKRAAAVNVGIDKDPSVIAGFDGADVVTAKAGDDAGVTLIAGDAIDYLKGRRFGASDLVYCDPPYPLSARKAGRVIYRHEMTEDDHRRLLSVVSGLRWASRWASMPLLERRAVLAGIDDAGLPR